jgi:UDP-N-acetylglucosamine 2-epimerase
VGSTAVDVCKYLDEKGLIPKNDDEYVLLTLHRRDSTDVSTNLSMVINQATVLGISMDAGVLFPCHPHTLEKIKEFKIRVPKSINILTPQSIIEHLTLIKNAKVVLTDSYTVPIEAHYFKVPCLIIQRRIEHDILLTENTALAGKSNDIVKISKELLAKDRSNWKGLLFGDGSATNKIYDEVYREEGR